jgi:cytochrome c peroxidase
MRPLALQFGWCFLALALAPAAAAPRLVWRGPEVNLLGAPSPDGRWLSFVQAGDLALRDLQSGTVRRLTQRPAGSKEFAYFSVFSRDSQTVAYAWFNQQGFYDLRLIRLDGGAPSVIFSNEEAGFVQPCAWTPDNQQVLTLLFRKDNVSQIALLPTASPAGASRPRILKSLAWSYPKRMDLSPDGREIVYDNFARQGEPSRRISRLAVDGAREASLDDSPSSRVFPLWTPQGRSVVYVDEASANIIEQPLADVRPQVLAEKVGRVLLLGVTSAGTLYYGLRQATSNIFVVPAGGTPVAITTRFAGLNSGPAWSPDGTTLAYLSRRGSENYGTESRAVVINRLDSGQERELTLPLALIERVAWRDDRTLLVKGGDSKGRSGIFCVDLASQEPTLCDSPLPERAHLHPDGKQVAITTGQSGNEIWALDLPVRLTPPLGLDAYVPVPASNPLTHAKVELGRRLFHDPRLSRDGTISCASCHDPQRAFADARPLAVGIGGQTGDRRSPRIANRAWGQSFFWDGRARTLEEQVLQPIANPKEMALDPRDAAVRVGLTLDQLQQSLASYVRTILAGDSPYDRYVAGDAAALSAEQRAGLNLFRGKAGCVVCHVGPNLTDEMRHGPDRIKTPSLRDVARTPPYMHTGTRSTLAAVIGFYDQGGHDNRPLRLTPGEKDALIAFLGALNGVIRDGLD